MVKDLLEFLKKSRVELFDAENLRKNKEPLCQVPERFRIRKENPGDLCGYLSHLDCVYRLVGQRQERCGYFEDTN